MKVLVNGTEVHYEISGSGEDKIVLLHGWGCDMSLMKPVSDAFSGDSTVLLIDFPGHGQSGRPPCPWGVPYYAECLMQLLEMLSFTPCSVIAHSFGCRVAAWIEGNHPSFFRSILFTGAAGIRPKPSEEALRKSAEFKMLKNRCEKLKALPLMGPLAEKMEGRLREKYGSRDYNALDEEMRKTFVKVINEDLSGLYEHFQAPTLLIWGDQDTETPLWMGKEMEKRIPDAGLVIFEGGSHFAYLEQIQRFNLIARQFLKGEG